VSVPASFSSSACYIFHKIWRSLSFFPVIPATGRCDGALFWVSSHSAFGTHHSGRSLREGGFFPFPMLPVNKVPKKNLISKKNGTDRRLTKPENFLCNNNKYGKALDKGSVMGVLHREQRKDLFLFSSLCASLPPHFYLVWGPALSAS